MMHDTGLRHGLEATPPQKIIPVSGFKILATETYNIGDPDMTSQLQKMQQAGSSRSSTSGSVPRTRICSAAPRRSTTSRSGPAPGVSPTRFVHDLAGEDLRRGRDHRRLVRDRRQPGRGRVPPEDAARVQGGPVPDHSAQGYDAAQDHVPGARESCPGPEELRDAIEQVEDLKALLGCHAAIGTSPPPLAGRQGHVRGRLQERPARRGRLGCRAPLAPPDPRISPRTGPGEVLCRAARS